MALSNGGDRRVGATTTLCPHRLKAGQPIDLMQLRGPERGGSPRVSTASGSWIQPPGAISGPGRRVKRKLLPLRRFTAVLGGERRAAESTFERRGNLAPGKGSGKPQLEESSDRTTTNISMIYGD